LEEKAAETYKMHETVNGNKGLSCTHVFKWFRNSVEYGRL